MLLLASCAPKLSPSITKSYAPLSSEVSVKVYAPADLVASEFEILGTVKVSKLNYATVKDSMVTMYKLKKEAREYDGTC